MAWVLIGQALAFVGSFVGIKVLTTTLGPEGYGQLALGLTIAGLFNMYLYGPLANVVARFYAVYRERGLLAVYFVVLRKAHAAIAVFLAVVAGIVGVVVWLWFGREWALIGIIAIIYSVVGGVNASFISLQGAIRQRQVVALHQGIDVWLRTALSLLILLLFPARGFSALLGYALGTFITTVSQAHFARKCTEFSEFWHADGETPEGVGSSRREFLAYATSFMVFSGFATISMYADRWIIQGVLGANDVGVYAAIYQIAASPVNILFSVANQLMVPIIFERAGAMTTADQAAASSRLVFMTVVLSGCAALLLSLGGYLFGDLLIKTLTSSHYAQFPQVLWILIVGLSLFNIGQLLSLKGTYFNTPKVYFWPKAVQALTLLATAYVGAHTLGISGVAYAICFSSCIYCIAVMSVNSRIRFNNI